MLIKRRLLVITVPRVSFYLQIERLLSKKLAGSYKRTDISFSLDRYGMNTSQKLCS